LSAHGRASCRGIKPYLQVVELALLEALCSGSEQCVETLIDHGADITEFGVERRHFRNVATSPEDKLARCRQALEWKILLKSCHDSDKTQHVVVMLEQLKDAVKDRPASTTIVCGPDKAGTGVQPYTYQQLRDKAAKKPNWRATLYDRDLENKTEELDAIFFCAIDSVSRMDALLRALMGEYWSFSAGVLGKTWDLFLCMVLLNRHSIAKICWKKIDSPVRAALVACKMYREMAKQPHVREEVQLEMEVNAKDFEKMATDVMLLAMEENMCLAIESLETRVAVLGGNTILDLAIDCKARIFVKQCCAQAMDARFYGDLSSAPPKWLPWFLPFPQWIVILACVLLAGIPAPFLLDFKLPPDAESCRAPTQRRKIPKGYPDRPDMNDTLSSVISKKDFGGRVQASLTSFRNKVVGSVQQGKQKLDVWEKLEKDVNRIKNFSEDQTIQVWQPTFTIWERWLCFLQAPIVHFQARAVIYTSVVIQFTYAITEVQIKAKSFEDATCTADGENQKQLQALQERMGVVAVYMAGSAFIEFSQMTHSGIVAYISDSWNFIDISTLVMFFFGFFLETVYTNFGELASLCDNYALKLFDWPKSDNSTEILDDKKKWFCVCLFFCWLRLLHLYSVNKTLGKLVRAIWLMVQDIGTFIFVWGFFLMAFAAAMYAGEVRDDGEDAPCDYSNFTRTGIPCDPPKNADNIAQWKSWWILRTYLQAYGEMDLDGLNDWVSVTIFMVLLLVLQLVLNNTVFVAVLTAKFEGVLEESETDWLFEMYDISEEFLKHPVPSPFNILWMFWEWLQFVKDEPQVQKLIEQELSCSLLDEADARKRWWNFHQRLRHPRFDGALLIPHLPLETKVRTDHVKPMGWFMSSFAVCSKLLSTLRSLLQAAQYACVSAAAWGVAEFLDGANMARAEQDEKRSDKDKDKDRREGHHRDGEVRRRDRALVMRAKAKYLEKQDDSAGHMEEMRAKLKSVEKSVRELSKSVEKSVRELSESVNGIRTILDARASATPPTDAKSIPE